MCTGEGSVEWRHKNRGAALYMYNPKLWSALFSPAVPGGD